LFSFRTFEPHIKLQKWIKSYWIVDYNKINKNKFQEKIITPYDNVCMIFAINHSNVNSFLKSGIYIFPPSMKRQILNLDDSFYYIDVSLYPGVFFKLFGIPLYELEDRAYEINELSLNLDLSILETLFNLRNNINSTINYLNNYFFKIFKNLDEDTILSNLYQLTKSYNLDNFYQQNRLSMRQVQRKVKEFTGITPKDIQRVNRFYHTLTSIKTNKSIIDFGNIAVENNFYDQSSFIKEFKIFTGLTPKLFLENSDNFLQYRCNIFC
jgi:AraC-like DNA-binding protein